MLWGIVKSVFGGKNKDGKGLIERGVEAYTDVRAVHKVSATKQFDATTDGISNAQQMDIEQSKQRRSGIINDLFEIFRAFPRPALANGTIFLFGYAFYDPAGFTEMMVALDNVPEQLWYMLGVIVSFYFGVREVGKLRKTNYAKTQGAHAVEMAKHRAEEAKHKATLDSNPSVSGGNAAIAKIRLD